MCENTLVHYEQAVYLIWRGTNGQARKEEAAGVYVYIMQTIITPSGKAEQGIWVGEFGFRGP
jgi:hypothetical protein